jgi:hypothetical protein
MENKRIKQIRRSIIELSTVWGIICLGFLFWIFEIKHYHFFSDIPVPSYSIGALCVIMLFNIPSLTVAVILRAILTPLEGVINPYILLGISYFVMIIFQGGAYYYLGKLITYFVLPKLE